MVVRRSAARAPALPASHAAAHATTAHHEEDHSRAEQHEEPILFKPLHFDLHSVGAFRPSRGRPTRAWRSCNPL
ncbi:exported hypothetical protein [Thiomonas arsenitoxydans]|uniref:Secreted protein n=1 Tax=Thiomonas arsenitoxydans (strain DSM 22701 / CIP 110005 / 3As) TaxID=426114 RepID=A0ABP1Z6P7_THIA3|nr:exported hypothetical protein [Thiomonas arsenitoxydans]